MSQVEKKMIKRYFVSVPILAIAVIEVEANSEENAIDYAVDHATLDDVDEWEPHKNLLNGNVFNGSQSLATISSIESL